MSSRVFQSVIVQMKEATDRMIGVIDADSTVISCSDTSRIGEKMARGRYQAQQRPGFHCRRRQKDLQAARFLERLL